MSDVINQTLTADDLFFEMKRMPEAERIRFFTLLTGNAFRENDFTHDQVFGHLQHEPFSAAEAAEYLAHGMTSQELEDIVQASWNAADADGSGFLDQKELKHFLRDLPIGLTKKEMNIQLKSTKKIIYFIC
jgi:hypothetical protein